ncbi:TPA: flagellin FliC, partial [Candidatus Poribacteria bacterium]|nr:flagellin FliC [Candidatus Poribacteria bacterium]
MSIFSVRSNSTVSQAYNNLSRVQSSLNANIGRLSSGLRINSASDDSAGSSVAVRMVSQINGMKQANANAQQANNLLQTAESGLSDISDILGRMRELAVQASTDTLNDTDRGSIDLEFQALQSEISRIASATEYDDNALLDGSYNNKSLQIGADNDSNHQLSISIGDATSVYGLELGKTALSATIADTTTTTISVDST